jgi:hypothetical protein
MVKRLLSISALLLMLLLPLMAHASLLDGHDWPQLKKQAKLAYVAGFTGAEYVLGLSLPNKVTNTDVVDEVDVLYRDPRNRSVKLDYIIVVAEGALSGKTQAEVEAALETLRKIAAKETK